MLDQHQIHQAVQFLLDQHQNRQPFTPIPDPYAPRTLQDAYAIQDAHIAHLAGTQGSIAGYKIALTNTAAQQNAGMNEPAAGVILAHTIHPTPYTIPFADYVHLGVECEIAVQMAATLAPANAPYSRAQVENAIGALIPAFELLDNRGADPQRMSELIPSGIADNLWNIGIVLGAPITNWQALDLAAIRGTTSINGQLVAEGFGRNVMGHPLDALTWLVNHLAAHSTPLTAGMIIITGSFVSVEFPHPGDTVQSTIKGLGQTQLTIT